MPEKLVLIYFLKYYLKLSKGSREIIASYFVKLNVQLHACMVIEKLKI